MLAIWVEFSMMSDQNMNCEEGDASGHRHKR